MTHDLSDSLAYVSAMFFKSFLKAKLDKLRHAAERIGLSSTVLTIAFGVAAMSMSLAEATGRTGAMDHLRGDLPDAIAALTANPSRATPTRLVWAGADLDGDGQMDVANPTGRSPRVEDAYGEGRFHASRDGGAREHEGVDYLATAGQRVDAPISGFVSKIGYAYSDDSTLRFVEIENPALHISARVFYVDPSVEVGDTVAIGHPIGRSHSLQHRYPGGILDHVHLELADGRGRKLDAERLIFARAEPFRLAAAAAALTLR